MYRTRKTPVYVEVRLQKLKHRKTHLFSHLISGNNVAIGPFEYLGSAYLFTAGRVTKQVPNDSFPDDIAN